MKSSDMQIAALMDRVDELHVMLACLTVNATNFGRLK